MLRTLSKEMMGFTSCSRVGDTGVPDLREMAAERLDLLDWLLLLMSRLFLLKRLFLDLVSSSSLSKVSLSLSSFYFVFCVKFECSLFMTFLNLTYCACCSLSRSKFLTISYYRKMSLSNAFRFSGMMSSSVAILRGFIIFFLG